MEEEAPDDHEGEDLGGELRRWDDLHAEIERAVVFLMLERVTALVGRDADRGDRSAIVDIGGEAELFVGGVVVVAAHVIDLLHPHVVDSRIRQNSPRGLRSRDSGDGRDLLIGLEGRGNAKLSPKAEGKRDTDQKNVEFKGHGFIDTMITDIR